jgi:hypothetical protein
MKVNWWLLKRESERGGHAHYELEQILIAVAGKIIIDTELLSGKKEQFVR